MIALVMGKIEVVSAQGPADPTGGLDEGRPVYVASQTNACTEMDNRIAGEAFNVHTPGFGEVSILERMSLGLQNDL